MKKITYPKSNRNILSPAKPTEVYDAFWYLACERQNIFFRRQSSGVSPWSEDPILSQYKFTNAYRASDRVSQYLIKNVIYNRQWSDEDLLFRILLFKIFNSIETWEYLLEKFGEPSWQDYDYDKYNQALKSL